MKQKYSEWISKNVKEYTAKCEETTKEMNIIFPELKRVRGHYYDILFNKRYEHWWLVDEENEDIVDPTVKQFTYGEYIPWNEESIEPKGKCLECGEYVYGNEFFCEKCMVERKMKKVNE